MADNYFVVDTQLPSLNEYQNACRTNAHKGASFKKHVEEIVMWAILGAKSKGTLHNVEAYPAEIYFEWHEKNKRRDVDNIKSAAKFILDAMTKMGIIQDDGRRFISQIHDKVIDDKRTYVVVKICQYEVQNDDIRKANRQTRIQF